MNTKTDAHTTEEEKQLLKQAFDDLRALNIPKKPNIPFKEDSEGYLVRCAAEHIADLRHIYDNLEREFQKFKMMTRNHVCASPNTAGMSGPPRDLLPLHPQPLMPTGEGSVARRFPVPLQPIYQGEYMGSDLASNAMPQTSAPGQGFSSCGPSMSTGYQMPMENYPMFSKSQNLNPQVPSYHLHPYHSLPLSTQTLKDLNVYPLPPDSIPQTGPVPAFNEIAPSGKSARALAPLMRLPNNPQYQFYDYPFGLHLVRGPPETVGGGYPQYVEAGKPSMGTATPQPAHLNTNFASINFKDPNPSTSGPGFNPMALIPPISRPKNLNTNKGNGSSSTATSGDRRNFSSPDTVQSGAKNVSFSQDARMPTSRRRSPCETEEDLTLMTSRLRLEKQ